MRCNIYNNESEFVTHEQESIQEIVKYKLDLMAQTANFNSLSSQRTLGDFLSPKSIYNFAVASQLNAKLLGTTGAESVSPDRMPQFKVNHNYDNGN